MRGNERLVAERRPVESVLDASALLAWLRGEPGGREVGFLLSRSSISSVNWSEVVQKVATFGLGSENRRAELEALGLRIVGFDRDDAEMAASLWQRAPSLSLADRACLALADRLTVPAVTADRVWAAWISGFRFG